MAEKRRYLITFLLGAGDAYRAKSVAIALTTAGQKLKPPMKPIRTSESWGAMLFGVETEMSLLRLSDLLTKVAKSSGMALAPEQRWNDAVVITDVTDSTKWWATGTIFGSVAKL